MVVFTPAVAGCLLLLSWLQHPRQLALGVWGSGFLTAAVAATLIIVGRGAIPDFWSIVVGNALLTVAYGILWCGARTFEGKTVSIPLALAGIARLAHCLLDRPDLCAARSARFRNCGHQHLLHAIRCP